MVRKNIHICYLSCLHGTQTLSQVFFLAPHTCLVVQFQSIVKIMIAVVLIGDKLRDELFAELHDGVVLLVLI